MRFLMTINGGGPAPDAELYARMGEFIDELSKAGVLVATGGLAATGTHVRAEGGKVTFTDGPYAEAKETIVSFAVLDLPVTGGRDRAVPPVLGDPRRRRGRHPADLWTRVTSGPSSRRRGGRSRPASWRAWPGWSGTSGWPRN
jgi:hypothetical protein